MNRRDFVLAGAALLVAPRALRAAAPPTMTVYKSPSCGCCKNWVAAAQKAGFTVKVVDLDDLSEIKKNAGVPDSLQSCHTVLVGAYVVEGHVPLDLVSRMLAAKPAFVGLAVPGMVVGSPGMEQGAEKQPYDVIAWVKGGKTSVYAKR